MKNDDQRPATSDQRPATSDQRPATSDQRPATSDQRPSKTSEPLKSSLLDRLDELTHSQLKAYLAKKLTESRLGLVWERDEIEFDRARMADLVLPVLVDDEAGKPVSCGNDSYSNLIIEGDNFDALRLLRTTHAHKIRVIYIDPPYNTGEKDWVYNDHYVGKTDRYRHSMWLEFLFQRLTLARDLLAPDGVILVSINDENRSRLELLMDEIFSGMRLGSFVWKTRSGSNDESGAQFSVDHEHVLIYGRSGFKFRGEEKNFSLYKNPDNDPRGRWKTGDLTQGKSLKQRANGYYPIQNPETGIWYPCNPSRVWAFASENNVEDITSLAQKTMEQYIREEKVLFPKSEVERVVVWSTKAELLDAIASGDVPIRPKTKAPLITNDLPDLDFWVGRPVGFGRPWFKRHLCDIKSDIRPISSWIRGASEDTDQNCAIELTVLRSGTGEHSVNEILETNAFPFPKPPSLIRSMIEQASNPGDIVLDFFAGSGTTAHAVLAINAENTDEAPRRFIMVSSRESTKKDPDRNICLDICAERIRRVVTGYGKTQGLGGEFAYLRLLKLSHADSFYDITPEMAWHRLSLKHTGKIHTYKATQVNTLAHSSDTAILFCAEVDEDVLMQLLSHPAEKLRVYSDRPDSVASHLLSTGKAVESLSWAIEAIRGQQQ